MTALFPIEKATQGRLLCGLCYVWLVPKRWVNTRSANLAVLVLVVL